MSTHPGHKTLLMISQVYPPDPASVGQHMAEVAEELTQRGWRVVVITANRGYDNPSVKYPSKESRHGVSVHRLPLSSFGKRSIPIRLMGSMLFVLQAIAHGLFTRNLAHILVSTSPPICSAAALAIKALRRVPITYWVMDLNPDQAISLGRVKDNSILVRLFNTLNRTILNQSKHVITLDRFMASRLIDKFSTVKEKLTIIPPWPHIHNLKSIEHSNNPFRAKHGLEDKFVIMYSGNLSIASPLDTVLEAALRLQEETNLIFVFIGGGLGKQELDRFIETHQPTNIVSLPYQPLPQIKYSLSAADVHLVSVGEKIVGICHPCKVYGAMAVQRPILLLGPDPCHISDILQEYKIGWHLQHGDVDAAVKTIRQIINTDPSTRTAMGLKAQEIADNRFNKVDLCSVFCNIVEDNR